MRKIYRNCHHSLCWLLAYEKNFLLPLLVKRLAKIRKALLTTKNSGLIKEIKETRRKIVLRNVRKRKRVLVRLLLFTILFKNRNGQLKPMVLKIRKKNKKSQKKAIFSRQRKPQTNRHVIHSKLVLEGLKEAFFTVLVSNEIIKAAPPSQLITTTTRKQFETRTTIALKGQKASLNISPEFFRKIQALFSTKMQSLMLKTLIRSGPLGFLNFYAKSSTEHLKKIEGEPMGSIVLSVWDLMMHAKMTMRKVDKKRAQKTKQEMKTNKRPKGPARLKVNLNSLTQGVAFPVKYFRVNGGINEKY